MRQGGDEKTRQGELVHPVPGSGSTACLIQIYGRRLGERFNLYDDIVSIGRDAQNTIVVDSDSVSRRHAVLEVSKSGWVLRDLGSTNGTYLNDLQIRSVIVSDGDTINIGGTIFKHISGHNIERHYHETIYEMTIKDGLTNVANKRHFLERLELEESRSVRFGRPASVVLIDIDNFSDINKSYGRISGDFVLHEFATVAVKHIHSVDVFARYGGDLFALLLPETTYEEALSLAESLRLLALSHPFVFEGHPLRVSVRCGVASGEGPAWTSEGLIDAAERALYWANRRGGNCVAGSREHPASEGHRVLPRVLRREALVLRLREEQQAPREVDPEVLGVRLCDRPYLLARGIPHERISALTGALQDTLLSLLGPGDYMGLLDDDTHLVVMTSGSPGISGGLDAVRDLLRRLPSGCGFDESLQPGILLRSWHRSELPADSSELTALVQRELAAQEYSPATVNPASATLDGFMARLPFPVSGPLHLVQCSLHPVQAAHALFHCLESILRFSDFVLLAAAAEGIGPKGLGESSGLPIRLDRGKVSLGEWVRLFWKLSALVRDCGLKEVSSVAVEGASPKGTGPSRLINALSNEMVPVRNVFAHGVALDDGVVRKHLEALTLRLKELVEILAPLQNCRLITVNNLIFNPENSSYDTSFYDHTGANGAFRVGTMSVGQPLPSETLLKAEGWTLRLAPLIVLSPVGATGGQELLGLESLEMQSDLLPYRAFATNATASRAPGSVRRFEGILRARETLASPALLGNE